MNTLPSLKAFKLQLLIGYSQQKQDRATHSSIRKLVHKFRHNQISPFSAARVCHVDEMKQKKKKTMIVICHHYKYLKLIKRKAIKLFPQPERCKRIKVCNTSKIVSLDSKITAWFSWLVIAFFFYFQETKSHRCLESTKSDYITSRLTVAFVIKECFTCFLQHSTRFYNKYTRLIWGEQA